MKTTIIGTGDVSAVSRALAIAAALGIGGVLAGDLPHKAVEVLPDPKRTLLSAKLLPEKPKFKPPRRKKPRWKKL